MCNRCIVEIANLFLSCEPHLDLGPGPKEYGLSSETGRISLPSLVMEVAGVEGDLALNELPSLQAVVSFLDVHGSITICSRNTCVI